MVVLSGAGISAESGIQTFRDADGLWEQYAIEDVATPEAWRKNAELVQHFYNLRRKQVMNAAPNAAHDYFAALQEYMDIQIITQNIDDLHERAGSNKVLHLHGNIRLAKSSGPDPEKKYYPVSGEELKMGALCADGYQLRPHVVWFGEAVPALEEAALLCEAADILIVIGTSLQVYPAASLAFTKNKNTRRFVIDPNCQGLQLPAEFTKIASGATEGVSILNGYLGLNV